MSAHQQAALRAWRDAPPGLPPELRVVAWEAGQADRVLAALLDERLSIVQNAPMNAESAAILSAARSRAEVLASRGCLAGATAEVSAAYRAELAAE